MVVDKPCQIGHNLSTLNLNAQNRSEPQHRTKPTESNQKLSYKQLKRASQLSPKRYNQLDNLYFAAICRFCWCVAFFRSLSQFVPTLKLNVFRSLQNRCVDRAPNGGAKEKRRAHTYDERRAASGIERHTQNKKKHESILHKMLSVALAMSKNIFLVRVRILTSPPPE